MYIKHYQAPYCDHFNLIQIFSDDFDQFIQLVFLIIKFLLQSIRFTFSDCKFYIVSPLNFIAKKYNLASPFSNPFLFLSYFKVTNCTECFVHERNTHLFLNLFEP